MARRAARERFRRRSAAVIAASLMMATAGCTVDTGVEATQRRATGPSTGPFVGVDLTVDADTQIVTLDNGLVVYLRHNDRPGNHVDMRLAVNAGSGMESAQQAGIAHFLEHMLFNGTESYPGNELVDVLRDFGMEFGADLNAYTSYDETVYSLTVPLDDDSHLETAIDVMAEWLSAATIEEAEVVAERGVVLDEWRVRDQTSDGRFWVAVEQQYLAGSDYADRPPIGSQAAIESMTAADLRDFYDTWYRPDNAALVVVGDIDVDEVEQMVRDRFGGLSPRADSPARPQLPVGPFDQPQAGSFADPDVVTTTVLLGNPTATTELLTTADVRQVLLSQLALEMISTRLADDITRGSAPFLGSGIEYLDPVRPMEAPAVYVEANGDDTAAAVDAVLVELERARRFGFSDQEVARLLATYQASLDSVYESRDTVQDGSHADRMVSHFLSGQPLTDIEFLFDNWSEIYDSITAADIEAAFDARLAGSSPHVLVVVPEGAEAPGEQDLLSAIASMPEREIEPREADAEVGDSLMARPAFSGGAQQEPYLFEPGYFIDSTRIVFDNGATVILNTTDIIDEQVAIYAMSPGGLSAVDDADLWAAQYATRVATGSGLGDLDAVQVSTVLEGADAVIDPYIAPAVEGFSGSATTDDVELAFQLLHLYLSEPRFTQAALDTALAGDRPYIDDPLSDPDFASYDAFVQARYPDDPRFRLVPTAAEADAITLDAVERTFRDRFSNASDWVFVLSGDFDADEVAELAGAYIGTLEGDGSVESAGARSPAAPAGVNEVTVRSGTGDTASLLISYTAEAEGDDYEGVLADLLTQVLQIRLTDHIREELGASYSPYASVAMGAWPDRDVNSVVYVSGAPDDMQRLIDVAHADLAAMAARGPTADELRQAVAALQDDYNLFGNEDVALFLLDPRNDDLKLEILFGRYDALSTFSEREIAAFAARVMPADQYIEVLLLPA